MERPLVVGHSLGGVVAQLLAERTSRVTGLVSIEGNLASEDCTLTRPIAALGSRQAARELLAQTAASCLASPLPGYREYGENLERRVDPRAFFDYGRSLVTLSNSGNLLARFLALRIPRLLVCGERSHAPSYLGALASAAVPVAVIAGAAHFPTWTHPDELWAAMVSWFSPNGDHESCSSMLDNTLA
jgi:pimeloyl-ACP methyl ester carboxylesterase